MDEKHLESGDRPTLDEDLRGLLWIAAWEIPHGRGSLLEFVGKDVYAFGDALEVLVAQSIGCLADEGYAGREQYVEAATCQIEYAIGVLRDVVAALKNTEMVHR